MKSIANQYRDLREGKMTQSNFMRNLRMTMPQYITNVTSFNDAVKILRNKSILTEAEINELSPQTKYNAAMKAVDKSYMSDNPSDIDRKKAIRQGNKFVSEIDPVLKKAVEDFGNSLGFNTKIEKGGTGNKLEPIIQILMGKELRAPEIKVTIKKGTDKIEGGYNLPDEAAERRLGNLIKQIQQKELDVELKEGYADEAPSYDYNGKKLYVDNQSGEPDAPGGTVSLYDEDDNEYTGIISSIDREGMIFVDEESIKPVAGGEDEDEMSDLIRRIGQEEEEEKAIKGGFGIQDPLEEGRKKKEPKKELHPNQIHPQELRMGIKVELEHTDDLDKAKKIALDHLAENPFYYTALKLSGIESPSAPKVKAPVAFKKEVSAAVELVDKANAMQKVKMPKIVKEARLNIDGEPNAVVKQAMTYVDGPISNPVLQKLSDRIEFQQTMDPNEALLRYDYWKELPEEAVEKLKLQFNVEVDKDDDEDTGTITVYRLTPKRKPGNLGSSLEMGASKASKMDAFKEALEKLVRETLAETFDGRDNLANITDDTK
jgi:hypothetical protein